ncbi:MAG: RHS repeat-associated core domain-containing protein, partial [Bryobacteraceae bacterium]
ENVAGDIKDFPARVYQTTQGRWVTPDPAGLAAVDLTNPQSWNRYAYVGGNPLGNVDPSGLDCVTFDNGTTGDDGQGTPCAGSHDPSITNVSGGSFAPVGSWAWYMNGGWRSGNSGYHPLTYSGGGSGGGQQPSAVNPPKNGTKQTFSACMAAHANDFSVAGALNHTYNAITGSGSLAFQNNFFAQAVLGNPITTVAYGSTTDSAGTAASLAPAIMQTGMGAVTSYGRRTTTIMALNLAGEGGVPLALGAASAGAKAAIGRVANVAGGFMSLEVSLAVNVGFTAAEAAYCASQP